MKKIKTLIIAIILISLTGCLKKDSMEDIKIVTSSYPIEYVVNELYGEHSTITSIYPKDDETISFEVTDVLLEQYSDNELFIFNGLSKEKQYLKQMSKNNKELMLIDFVGDDIKLENINAMEELWLDPNNLLAITNNIRKRFKGYIDSTYLINEIDSNYENLKIKLTSLDGKYYSIGKNASANTIIVSDDAFLFLKKYGLKVISIDPDTAKDKTIDEAKRLLSNGTCKYLFIKYLEDDETINTFINETGAQSLQLYTMTNLKNLNVEKNNYITLMDQNLETLKLELYK
ncbi:MAG: zinc ABC transporter substrate-binding protein [Bacilli bacterium]|nr:zinc ABC transporter substrate-binding protein [Bacilli bacterium]